MHELDVKETEKDLGDNFAPVLRNSKKKGENLMSWWDKELRYWRCAASKIRCFLR